MGILRHPQNITGLMVEPSGCPGHIEIRILIHLADLTMFHFWGEHEIPESFHSQLKV